MSLLKTKEFIDSVELSNFLHEHYDYPALGSSDSFHRTMAEALSYPSNGEMVPVEMPLPTDEDGDQWLTENYGEDYQKMVHALWRLIEDGHLPAREEFEIYIWW